MVMEFNFSADVVKTKAQYFITNLAPVDYVNSSLPPEVWPDVQ